MSRLHVVNGTLVNGTLVNDTLPTAESTGTPAEGETLTVAAVREKLAGARGRELWRSLSELAETPQFEELMHREFPRQASEWAGGGVDRRRFLQLMSGALALGGLTACTTQPREKIVPYVDQPEGLVPGVPWFFASTHTLGGYGRGVLVESHMGRPTKVEGNREHPASLGATDVFAQASVLDLYDPDRAQTVRRLGRFTTWEKFVESMRGALNAQGALGGAGVRLLTGAVSSPTLLAQIEALLAAYPQARWHVWEPSAGYGRLGTRRVFGDAREAVYDVAAADVVLTLDSDFLTAGPGAQAYARRFTGRRRDGATGEAEMIRLYSVESTPTATGTLADHRMSLPPAEIAAFARALAGQLGAGGGDSAGSTSRPQATQWVTEVAADLQRAGSAALVVAGEHAAPEIHELAARINQALGAVGSTVDYRTPVVAAPADPRASLAALHEDLEAGAVDLLVVAGGNPVFTAPADLAFGEAMKKAGLAVYLGQQDDETADYCEWLIPESHYLEAWGDARAFDGTASLVQPLIEPLYEASKSAAELVATLAGASGVKGYDLVREQWQGGGLGQDENSGGGEFETAWRKALHDGVLPADTAAPAPQVAAGDEDSGYGGPPSVTTGAPDGAMTIVFRPDPTIGDGACANNPWLQELPKPLTKLTWDNALLVSPRTAEALGVEENHPNARGARASLVQVTVGGRTLQVPAWIVPGHADGCATLHVGYGRRRVGRVGEGTGFDAYALRGGEGLWAASGRVETIEGRYPLACTQDHASMEGRHLVRSAPVEHFREHPEFAQHVEHVPGPDESMFPPHPYDGYAWGMAFDLGACTGCNACVVACQAENNIPTVGKEQVLRAREMHWLRIDRYYEGSIDEPTAHHQPVACQHCENAPCEVVCPVAATVHSDEGTNDMVYNRCVGTRYCSNNCPYKVRRFNFFEYVDEDTELLKAVRNPDVTVRTRGVMEKCSYCIQRVNKARIAAKREERTVRDGEIVTACQQACPSDAIVFGDVNDADSRVSRWKALPLDYTILAELNTRPRTSYLAKLTNPNPALGGSEHAGAAAGGDGEAH